MCASPNSKPQAKEREREREEQQNKITNMEAGEIRALEVPAGSGLLGDIPMFSTGRATGSCHVG